MKLLEKPYTQSQYNKFVEECNNDGKLRIELHNGNAYAMYDYEIFENGEVIDRRGTEEYEAEQAEISKAQRKEEIEAELEELDKKRIRAVCEPDVTRDNGITWLEYYNNQIIALREELSSL